MKILVISNKPPFPPRDGGSIATWGLSKAMAAVGNDVHILAMNTSKHYVDREVLKINYTKGITIEYVDVDTSINPFRALFNLLFSCKPYNAVRFKDQEFSFHLQKLLSEEKFDVIQLEGPYLSFYIDIIRELSDALLVMRAHNVEYEIWERAAVRETNYFKKWYLNNLAKRIKDFETSVLNRYDAILPITGRDSVVLTLMGSNKPNMVVPVGIDVDSVKYVPNEQCQPSILYIGALDWIPNLEAVIWFVKTVWPMVKAKMPEVKFYVAGRNAAESLIQFLKHRDVNYMGEVVDSHIFMQKYRVMVVPLFSGSGMRVKIIEGMALGKTIITTTIGAEGIPVEHNKNILIADDLEHFTESLVKMLQDSETCAVIGQNAREFILNSFNNNLIAEELTSFYKNHLK